MCRHLVYLGPPTTLAETLLDPAHSLLEQTWAPAEMRGSGSVNADGFGVAWYDGPGDALRYRRSTPMWADQTFPGLARGISTTGMLAAVRNGTVGMPVTEGACAPFMEGRWLFSHNGAVAGWPDSVAPLAANLPGTDLLTLEAPTDSALLWALARQRLRAGAGVDAVVEEITLTVAEAAPGSRLNLLATDGETVAATTWGHSLSVLEEGDRLVVSSESFGPATAAWNPVGDRQLVVGTLNGTKIRPLTPKGTQE